LTYRRALLHCAQLDERKEASPVLLAVSVGNSHITFGVHKDKAWIHRWRIQTVHAKTSDEYQALLRGLFDAAGVVASRTSSAILSSVVPPLTNTMVETVLQVAGAHPLLLGPALDLGLRITTENPAEVGADLVANAVAAYDRFRGNCIVVDFGTALSFTAVAAPGELRGVAIAPGLTSAVESLARNTAQLPSVPLAPPPVTIGRNSMHSIQAGIVFGYVGLVDGIVGRMREELGFPVRVIATGGLAPLLAPESKTIENLDEMLTLTGLNILYHRNQ
jgi:type III pantothenate kinase